jgi:hypothetical protein
MCNVDDDDKNTGKLNVTSTKNIPDIESFGRFYTWMSTRSKAIREGKIFEAGFAGFGLFAIRRDVVKKIPFREDAEEGGCCTDVMFCHDCLRLRIPIMVDPNINMLHLKRADSDYERYHVGSKRPHTYLSS